MCCMRSNAGRRATLVVKNGATAVLGAILLVLGQAPVAAEREIYPPVEQARADLAVALRTAAEAQKRIIVDFGGNWCPDCQVLEIYLHDRANRPLLDANFVLVHINIGRIDQNLDIAARYQIPVDKGVPALAVLGENGQLLYSQKSGEFESMRRMQSIAVTNFLIQWKPATAK
jgi:thioredoxin 1